MNVSVIKKTSPEIIIEINILNLLNKDLYQMNLLLFLISVKKTKDNKPIQNGPIIAIPGKIIGSLIDVNIFGPDIKNMLALWEMKNKTANNNKLYIFGISCSLKANEIIRIAVNI
ncbi:hypothetical protein I0Q91_09855 [Halanaerobiaceae bacterium Z-7014]|uniref:Uncharacterized protein n=1 Tax=Halonatronomonas betaini TaxID=2778430 RepID=A0A931FAA0_9FIRM|nr:hypothetical protein [Halonatronomonas betaini]MBF8437384.1 hypothetical protein [Halonatronomonas betaini]